MTPNPIEIQSYLETLDYPIGKNRLMSSLAKENAPEDILELFSPLPEMEYGTPEDVSKALEDVQAEQNEATEP